MSEIAAEAKTTGAEISVWWNFYAANYTRGKISRRRNFSAAEVFRAKITTRPKSSGANFLASKQPVKVRHEPRSGQDFVGNIHIFTILEKVYIEQG